MLVLLFLCLVSCQNITQREEKRREEKKESRKITRNEMIVTKELANS